MGLGPLLSARQGLRLLLCPPGDAFTNMALDEALALTADTTPTFRVYYWSSPSISIGYFQKSAEVLNSLACRGTLQRAPTVVRRPTGGTAVLHNDQPSFSLVLRMRADVRQGYHLLGQAVMETLKALGMDARPWAEVAGPLSYTSPSPGGRGKGEGDSPPPFPPPSRGREFEFGSATPFCTSNLFPYDVILQGQETSASGGPTKVAGYSARRFQRVTLFQGYLHLPEPAEGGHLVEAIITGMEKIAGVRLMEGNLTEAETVLTRELRQKKYLQQDWNYKR
ncbi:MAG: hypothetical protein QMD05_01090 [Candidatus Brocadiaceae bacterium]|nr:hypothetical protein [Candidatus Brocadiaceae bacterium]